MVGNVKVWLVVAVVAVVAVVLLVTRGGGDSDPFVQRPGGAIDVPLVDEADGAPGPVGIADPDRPTSRQLQEVGDSGVTADMDAPVSEEGPAEEVDYAAYEKVAGQFATRLYSWDHTVPEADRVASLRPLVTGPAWTELNLAADLWEELDGSRRTAEETATADLAYLEPELPQHGRAHVRAGVTVERKDLYFGTMNQSYTLEMLLVQESDGSWKVESYTSSS